MEYLARLGTASGEIVERRFAAESADTLTTELSAKGYHVFSVRPKGGVWSWLRLPSMRGISNTDFLMFNHELATLVKAGLPILQSLEILLERMKNPIFREALTDIYQQVRSGAALSEAFASHPSLFPPLYSSSLQAGERSGELESVIRRYITYAKIIQSIRAKVTQALIYPVILLALSMTVVLVLLTVAIPKFSDLFSSFGRELPFLTRALVALSDVVRSHFIFLAIGVIAAFVVVRGMARTAQGRARIDGFKLKLPFVGPVWQKFAISQLTRALGTLLGGGIPLVTALEIAAGAVSNSLVSKRVGEGVRFIMEGQSLSATLERTELITPMVIEMVKVGEATGALTEMLVSISDYYDEEIDAGLNRVVAFLEPALLVVMGIIIAVMLLAMYLPIFSMQSVLQ